MWHLQCLFEILDSLSHTLMGGYDLVFPITSSFYKPNNLKDLINLFYKILVDLQVINPSTDFIKLWKGLVTSGSNRHVVDPPTDFTKSREGLETSRSRILKSVILINLNNISQLESPNDLINLMTRAQPLSLNQGPFGLIKDMDSIIYNCCVWSRVPLI